MEKQYLITIQLMAITGILSSILVSLVAFRVFVLPVSQADLSVAAPGVKAPYLRLVTDPISTVSGQLVVNVMANTNNAKVTEADVVLNYDPSVLELAEDGVASTKVLSVLQNTATVAGQINFSLFSSVEREEPLLQTPAGQENAIAQLKFNQLSSTKNLTQIEFEFKQGQLDESNLILYTPERQETATDILLTAEPLIINLK